jgi:hypothetical protein
MKYALMILQMIPAIISSIKSIEEFLPASGIGKEKLAIIRAALENTYDNVKDIWPAIEKVVGLLIDLANSTGVFKKSS